MFLMYRDYKHCGGQLKLPIQIKPHHITINKAGGSQPRYASIMLHVWVQNKAESIMKLTYIQSCNILFALTINWRLEQTEYNLHPSGGKEPSNQVMIDKIN